MLAFEEACLNLAESGRGCWRVNKKKSGGEVRKGYEWDCECMKKVEVQG